MKANASRQVDVVNPDDKILIGGLVAFAAHQADRLGDKELSRRLDEIFIDIAKELPSVPRQTLLLMSHEITLRDAVPERVKLYLVRP